MLEVQDQMDAGSPNVCRYKNAIPNGVNFLIISTQSFGYGDTEPVRGAHVVSFAAMHLFIYMHLDRAQIKVWGSRRVKIK